MTTALAQKEQHLPTSYEEVSNIAKAFVASGMFADTKQLSQAIVKIMAGKELGLPPVYSMQNINLIRNRLTSSANTLALLVKSSGKYDYRIKEHTDKACIITFFELEGGKWAEVGISAFTIEDAKRADLVKPDSGWAKYPRAMLFSRAISQGARIYAPDAIGGVYTDEEIRSIPPKDVSELDNSEPEAATIPLPAPEATPAQKEATPIAKAEEKASKYAADWIPKNVGDLYQYALDEKGLARDMVVEECKGLNLIQAFEKIKQAKKFEGVK